MKYKICYTCKEKKSTNDFTIDKKTKDGYYITCKICKSIYDKEYRLKNRDRYKKKAREYYLKNCDYIKNKQVEKRKQNPDYMIKWREENKEHIKEYSKTYFQKNKIQRYKYIKNKHKNNINFRVSENLRSRLYHALKSALKINNKKEKTLEYLGCTLNYLIYYLESKFKNGMNWENYGYNGWHIDHIKPCSLFDLSKKSGIKKCFHYTNLQPLWAEENFFKSNKIL